MDRYSAGSGECRFRFLRGLLCVLSACPVECPRISFGSIRPGGNIIMIERLVLSFFLIAALSAAAKIILSFLAWRMRRNIPCSQDFRPSFPAGPSLFLVGPVLSMQNAGTGNIRRTNILRQFGKQFDIRKINALEDRKTAELYRVMTVPTVILLDEDEQPVAVHPGFTRAKTISEQYLRSA